METRTNRKLFLIVLLSLSVVLTGCSRQLYTMLVSSEDESPRSLASLSGSPSNSESLASQQSQSKSDDLLQGRETAQILGADIPVEGLPLPTLRDSGIEPSLAHAGATHPH